MRMTQRTFTENAETLTDKLLDLAKNNPSSWAILLAYSAVMFGLGVWAGW